MNKKGKLQKFLQKTDLGKTRYKKYKKDEAKQ